jgi:hypothetical protein
VRRARRDDRANTPPVRRLEKTLAEERAATRAADLRWAMENPRGRRLLFELLYSPTTGLGLEEAPVEIEAALAGATAGKRATAKLWLDRMLRETPEQWIRMREEQLEDRDEKKHLREDAEETPDEEDDTP